MRKISLTLIAAVLFLAACSSQPTQTALPENTLPPSVSNQQAPAVQPTATLAAVPTREPTAVQPVPTDTSAPTAETVEIADPGVGLTAYEIVPGESQLQYEVGEVFINENNRFAVAVGVTPQVEGEILIDRAAPQNSQIGTITADISQFKSDSGRRDNAIRGRFLQSERYPTVTFIPTQIDGLPESYQEGQDIPLNITGDLTIREVTRPASFEAVVRLDGDQLTGQATTTILMSDYDFGPISVAGILKTEDEAKITLDLVARP
ncbi:MAG: YceI family protein [Anaerolineales bacterium]